MHTLRSKLYTATNSLEVRLSELISTRAFGRIRKVLTQVKNAKGEWERLKLAVPPDPADHPGLFYGGKKYKNVGNRDLGIFWRPVYAPYPLQTPRAMRERAQAMLGGRTLSLAIPSTDGFSGAGWDCLQVCKDVWQVAVTDKNLRAISGLRQNVSFRSFPPHLPLTMFRPHHSPPPEICETSWTQPALTCF